MRLPADKSAPVPARAPLLAYLCRFCLVTVLASAAGATWPADLEVEIQGVRPRAGEIHAALFDREGFAVDTEIRAMISPSGEISAGVFTAESQFPRPPVDSLTVPPSSKTLRLTFPSVEPGEYAVGVYQDTNGNGRLDATVAREPTEPWGISNNPRSKDHPVTWDEAKFTLTPEGAKIVIELR